MFQVQGIKDPFQNISENQYPDDDYKYSVIHAMFDLLCRGLPGPVLFISTIILSYLHDHFLPVLDPGIKLILVQLYGFQAVIFQGKVHQQMG